MTGTISNRVVFVRFALIGLGVNGTVYLLFIGLIVLGISPVVSTAICYVFGLILGYWLNRRWSFISTASHRSDMIRFLTAHGIGVTFATLSMWGLLAYLSPEIAQVVVIIATAFIVYGSLRLLKFGR
jgi:putative flippase GtrA